MTYTRIQEEMAPVYVEAGAGLLDCQRLESALGLLLLYLAKLGVAGLDVDYIRRILDGDAKKTAGQMLALLRLKVDVQPEVDIILTAGIASRNLFIHRFLMDNMGRVVDPQERGKVVAELRSIRATVQEAEHLMRPMVAQLAQQIDGFDMDQMRKLAGRLMLGAEEG